jgi:hypothetical protein
LMQNVVLRVRRVAHGLRGARHGVSDQNKFASESY